MRSSSASGGKPPVFFPPINSPNVKPPKRRKASTSSEKLPHLAPKNVIVRRETMPEVTDGHANPPPVPRSSSSGSSSFVSPQQTKRLPASDPYSTPARRRRLVADISRFLLKQYCIKACDNVVHWRHLTRCATRIQSIVRTHLARRLKLRLLLSKLNSTALRIQQIYRQHAALKELKRRISDRDVKLRTALALRLQCIQRQNKAKTQLQELRYQQQRRNAAMLRVAEHLQRRLRGHRSRRYAYDLKMKQRRQVALEQCSAIIIQCTYRVMLAKRVRAKLLRIHHHRCSAASLIACSWRKYCLKLRLSAVAVQRMFRGALGRALYRKQRLLWEQQTREAHESKMLQLEDIVSARYRQFLRSEEVRLTRYLQGSEPQEVDVRVEVQSDLLQAMHSSMDVADVAKWCCSSGLIQHSSSDGYELGYMLQRVLDCVAESSSAFTSSSDAEPCIDVPPAVIGDRDEIPSYVLPSEWNCPFCAVYSSGVFARPIEIRRCNSGDVEVILGAQHLDMTPFHSRSCPFIPRWIHRIRLVSVSDANSSESDKDDVEKVTNTADPGTYGKRGGAKKAALYRYDSSASDTNLADLLRLRFRDAVIEITQSESVALCEENADDADVIAMGNCDLNDCNKNTDTADCCDTEIFHSKRIEDEKNDVLVSDNDATPDECDVYDSGDAVGIAVGLLSSSASRPTTARVRVRVFDPEEQTRKAQQLRRYHCAKTIQQCYCRHLDMRRNAATAICRVMRKRRLLLIWQRAVTAVLLRAHLCARTIQTKIRQVASTQRADAMRTKYCINKNARQAAEEKVYEIYSSYDDSSDAPIATSYQICRPSAKSVSGNAALCGNVACAMWLDELLHIPAPANCVNPHDVIMATNEENYEVTDVMQSMGDLSFVENWTNSKAKRLTQVRAPQPLFVVSMLDSSAVI